MAMSAGVAEQRAKSVQNTEFGLITGLAGPWTGMNICPDHVILRLGLQSCGSTGVDSGSLIGGPPLRHLWPPGAALPQFSLVELEPGLFVARFMLDGMTVLTLHVPCTRDEC